MKILVIRFSSIGDVVLTTPVLRGLKEQVENVEIHYLTKQSFASILENNPRVDKVYAMNKHINELIADLKNEKYDLILDLHNNLRTKAVKSKLKRPSQSFSKLNWKKWLLVKFKVDKLPDVHIVDRYFEVTKTLGVKNDKKPCEYYINEKDEVDVHSKFELNSNDFVGLAIGAQFATKRMPKSLLLEIIEKISDPIILIGGPTDVELANDLIKESSKKNLFNACGKFNLNQSASIVKQSSRLITNDTGLMHIASCFDVQITSVWGNTVPSLGMYPYYPQQKEKFSIHEVKDLKCRPCSKIGYQECPKGHFNCMKMQDVDQIINGKS